MGDLVVTTMAEQQKERRFNPRVACELKDPQGQVVRNLSQNGLYLESAREYQPHQKISLSLPIFNGMSPLQVWGEVVRRESLRNGFGYGIGFRGIGADEYKELNYFILRRMTEGRGEGQAPKRDVFYKRIAIDTEYQNIAQWDPRLEKFLEPGDNFSIFNLTDSLKDCARQSGVRDGCLMAQILHTSATLLINELDEPMLLMDLVKKMRAFAPKSADYFHNSSMREVNICPDDSHCDRNGDAHVKAALLGNTTLSLIVQDGELVLGPWQKVALLEFDGPRKREVLVQVRGS